MRVSRIGEHTFACMMPACFTVFQLGTKNLVSMVYGEPRNGNGEARARGCWQRRQCFCEQFDKGGWRYNRRGSLFWKGWRRHHLEGL